MSNTKHRLVTSGYGTVRPFAAHPVFGLLLVTLIALLTGCHSPTDQPPGDQKVINDMLGRQVKVPSQPQGVIGIGPGALRLLVYMQATSSVVGVEEIEKRTGRPYIFAHPALQDKPTIGPAFTGDPELIAARKPDIIFKTYTTGAEADELQRKTGIPVVALRYINPDSTWQVLDSALTLMGQVLNNKERAQELIGYYQGMIDSLNRLTADLTPHKRPDVYLGGLSHRGTHGINSTSPWYEPFAFVHARNVAAELRKQYAKNEGIMVDVEQLMVWNPDIVFIDLAGNDLVRKDLMDNPPFFRKIKAFRNNQVYGVHPYNWYSTNYSTVLANAWYIASILYPEGHLGEIDPAKKANAIYSKFLGQPVYSQMKATYGGYSQADYNLESSEP
jgi:iron complex transport system substrate-binding protein